MAQRFDHAYRPFQSGQPATEADLQALEALTGQALPADYRAFLLRYNGGSLRPFAFELHIPDWTFEDRVHALDYLYELKEIQRRSQLRMEPALRNVPPGRLAIGTTVSELTLMLDLRPAGAGRVEVWVRDTFNIWGEGANKTVVPLADSFTAFLGLLADRPEVYSSFWASAVADGVSPTPFSLP